MRFELEGKKPLSEKAIMESLSARYGWTPNEIREQPVEDILQYLEIINELSKIEKIRQMKMKSK